MVVNVMVENFAEAGAVAPKIILSIDPGVDGFIDSVPEPLGKIDTA